MDPNVGAFLEVVNCRPEEVRDIPAGRLQSGCANPSREERRISLGETQIYFGKHAGQRLKDVPREYLAWALDQKPATKPFRKFQRTVRKYLGKSKPRFRRRKGRRRETGFIDPLTREFLEIVRSS